MPSTPEEAAEPAGRWWPGPALFGAALAALLLSALTPWSDALFDDELGTSPWWVATPALLAALVLLGDRRGLPLAGALAALAAALGAIGFQRGTVEREATQLFAFQPEPGRPVVPLLAALACLTAAALCALLHRRRAPWLPPTGDSGRKARLLIATTLAGALLAGAATVGSGLTAQAIQRAEGEEPRVDAISRTVPAEERDQGVELSLDQYLEWTPYAKPTEVRWQETLPGAAALTECAVAAPPVEFGQPADAGRVAREHQRDPVVLHGTLVSVEAGDGEDSVIGYDTADGSERWRYTVPHGGTGEFQGPPDHPGRLGQVGVSPDCRVLVVAKSRTLVTLDANSGEPLRETALPDPAHRFDNPARTWTFLTGTSPSPHEDTWRPVVALAGTPEIFLEAPDHLIEVRQSNGDLLSVERVQTECLRLAMPAKRPNPLHEEQPQYLLTQGCALANYTSVPSLPENHDFRGGLEAHEGPLYREAPLAVGRIHALGCPNTPHITDFDVHDDDQLRNHNTSDDRILFAGTWCDDFAGPLLLEQRDIRTVHLAELPPDTELPLRPTRTDATPYSHVWLDGGTLYGWLAEPTEDEEPEPVLTDGRTSYVEREYREIHTGARPLEAAFAGGQPDTEVMRSVIVYAVTDEGDVLALDQENRDAALRVYAELPEAAGTCAGDRQITVDRAGLKLLTWCETPSGTDVTAIALERRSSTPYL
ncbi:PQQ-binding-like beta-propeller repeat protein [Streptomyces profundus]|uniref:outer membrane protein assembly factor BamB family protein n=1 Tax=Streptomyces profundus TaxID=2867410 RepID=UPI001D162BF8|nr:PQQ-binding-like beta-propeller repeat protein [Streptomyces sp. MA3_2.13]UED84871.1 PQQ-like beta-propeller repeat protein [Streptomyces sp. MA3_2.13]